jgi:hypothetical protein
VIQEYIDAIQQVLSQARKISDQEVKVIFASDDEEYILAIKDVYPDRCECYPSIRKMPPKPLMQVLAQQAKSCRTFLLRIVILLQKMGGCIDSVSIALKMQYILLINISSLARSVLL